MRVYQRYYALQSLDAHSRYKNLLLIKAFRAIKAFKAINEELNQIKYLVIIDNHMNYEYLYE